jgi:hypothetical protein
VNVRWRRRLALAALTAAVLGAVAGGATAGGGANQAVIAQATADGASVMRTGLQVVPAGSPTVDSDNLAAATSFACTGCRTAAVAFQVVVATGSPSVVTPSNVAAATNAGCSACSSYAYAYQYVVTADRFPVLGAEAQAALQSIRERQEELARLELGKDDLDARFEELAADFRAIVDARLDVVALRSTHTSASTS